MKRKDIEAHVLWTVEEWQGVIDIPTLIGSMKEHTKTTEHEIRLAMEELVDKGKLHIDKWMHLRLGKNERWNQSLERHGYMSKPLTKIVAELERRIGGIRTRSMEKTVSVNEIELSRLLAAFRAGEKMRDGCGMAGHNMKPHGDCLVCSAMAAFDAAVRGDGE